MKFMLGNRKEETSEELATGEVKALGKQKEDKKEPSLNDKHSEAPIAETQKKEEPKTRIIEDGEETEGVHGQTIVKLLIGGRNPSSGGKASQKDFSLASFEGGAIGSKSSTFSAVFSKESTGSGLLSLSSKGYTISLSLIGAGKSAVEKTSSGKNASSVIYRNVRDGVDLEYRLVPKGIKETFVIGKRQESYRFESVLEIGKLKPEYDDKTGTLVLKDGNDVRFRILAPVMCDAGGSVSGKCSYDIEDSGYGKLSVVLSADKEWMEDKERRFPVRIDPSIDVEGGSAIDIRQYRDGSLISAVDGGYVFGARTEDGKLHEYKTELSIDTDRINGRVTDSNKVLSFKIEIPIAKKEYSRGESLGTGVHEICAFSDGNPKSVVQDFSIDEIGDVLSLELAKWVEGKSGIHTVTLEHFYDDRKPVVPGMGGGPGNGSVLPPIVSPGHGGITNPPVNPPKGPGNGGLIGSSVGSAFGKTAIQSGAEGLPSAGIAATSKSSDGQQDPESVFQCYAETFPLYDDGAPSAKVVYQRNVSEDLNGFRKEIGIPGNHGKSVVNVFDGNLTHSIGGLSVSSGKLSVPVDLLFDLRLSRQTNGDDFDKHMGKGWKTSLHQYIVKVNRADPVAPYRDVAYIDGNGDTHVFADRWFYRDRTGTRHYVDRGQIFVDVDGKVKWTDSSNFKHELEHEAKDGKGLTFVSGMDLSSFRTLLTPRKAWKVPLANSDIEVNPESDRWSIQFCYLGLDGEKTYVDTGSVERDRDGSYKYDGKTLFIDPDVNGRPSDGDVTKYSCFGPDGVFREKYGNVNVSYEYDESIPDIEDLYMNEDISGVDSRISQLSQGIASGRETLRMQNVSLMSLRRQLSSALADGSKTFYVLDAGNRLQELQNGFSEKEKNFIESDLGRTVYDDAIRTIMYGNDGLQDVDFVFDKDMFNTYEHPRQGCGYDFDDYEPLIRVYNYAVARETSKIQAATLEDQEKSAEYNSQISRDSLSSNLEAMSSQLLQLQSQICAQERAIKAQESELQGLQQRRMALSDEQRLKPNDFVVDADGNTLGFDGYGRLMLIQDKSGDRIDIGYEALRNTIDTAPDDIVTPRDSRILSVGSDTDRMLFRYAGAGRLLESITDKEGRRIRFSYEGEDLSSITFPDGGRLEIGEGGMTLSDVLDNKTGFTAGEKGIVGIGSWHSEATLSHDAKKPFVRNDLSQIIQDADMSISYDGGNVRTFTDAKNPSSVLKMVFDGKGNLVEYSDEEVTTISSFDHDRLLFSGTCANKDRYVLKPSAAGSSGMDVSSLAEANKISLPNSFMVGFEAEFAGDASSVIMKDVLRDSDGSVLRETSMTFDASSGRKYLLPIRMKRGEGKLDVSVSGGNVKESKLLLLSGGLIRTYLKEEDGTYDLLSEENADSLASYDGYHDGKHLSETVVDYTNPDHDVTTRTCFNPDGRVTYSENSDGNVEEHLYDAKGNETETRAYNKGDASLVRVSSKSYDGDGTPKEEDGTSLKSFKRTADSASVTTADHNGGISLVSCSYDHMDGNLLGIVNSADGVSNSTSFRYRGGLLVEMSSHGVSFAYDYDGKGRKKACFLNGCIHDSFRYEDDYSDSSLGISHGSHVLAEAYGEDRRKHLTSDTYLDNDGREHRTRLTAGDTEQTIDTTYDPTDKDRKTEVVSALTAYGQTATEKVHYSYSDDRLISAEKSVDDVPVLDKQFSYDSFGRLESVESNIGTLTQSPISRYEKYSYDPDGDISRIAFQGDKMILSFSKDALGRILGTRLDIPDGTVFSDDYGYLMRDGSTTDLIGEHVQTIGGSVDSFRYSYDEHGNITCVSSEEEEIRYSYDGMGRLVREDNPIFGKTYVYRYDSAGNILLRKSYAYSTEKNLFSPIVSEYSYSRDWRDQLFSFGGKSIRYDVLGRPTDYMGTSIEWDGRGLLKKLDPDGSGSAVPVTYGYDASGIRVSKTFSEDRHAEYVVDGTRVLALKMTSGNSEKLMVFTYAGDSLLGFRLNGAQYIYLKDIQGDITAIADRDGNVICRYYYDAYGNQKIVKSDKDSDIADINPFRYRGYFYDTESGFYYLNARYYDPRTGRFISPDDTSILDQTKSQLNGLNLYMYCGDNPVMRVDPTGRAWWDWLISSLAIAAGAVLCFIPGGQTLGISLLAGGISSMATNIMYAAGVDPKTISIMSSAFSAFTGAFLLATPFASLGAGMIGSGIGGLVGGYISEAVGGSFVTGYFIS